METNHKPLLNLSLFWHCAMLLAVVLGVYVRFKGLGTWPLAIDEYFMWKPVLSIVTQGVPAFDCGGYYTRGILYQYVVAPLVAAGLGAEFSLRLISVCSNLAALPAVYLLGKRVSGTAVACASVILFSISLWEIEFARFGRMYAPFQALFVWYLVVLCRVVIDGIEKDRRWLYGLSLFGPLLWEGGIFLALLNFVPYLFRFQYGQPSSARVTALLAPVAILLIEYLYLTFDFGGSAVGNIAPNISAYQEPSMFLVPPMLLLTLPQNWEWLLGAAAAAAFSVWAIYFIAQARPVDLAGRLGLALIVLLTLLGLFGLAIAAFVLLLLLDWLNLRLLKAPVLRIAAAAALCNFVFWLTYGLATTDWHQFFPAVEPSETIKKLLVVLLKYPNIFDQIVYPWVEAIPRLAVLSAIFIAVAMLWVLLDRGEEIGLRLLIFVLFLLALAVGAIGTQHQSTRYLFFLLPVVFLITTTALYRVISALNSRPKVREPLFALAMAGLILVSDDVDFTHALNIDSPEINYRLGYDEAKANHYYPRFDYKTPSEFINQHKQPNDIVINTLYSATHYLDRVDYFYQNHLHTDFRLVSCDLSRRDRWSDAPLIHTPDALFRTIDNAESTVWLVMRPYFNEFDRAIMERYEPFAVYTSVDRAFKVYRIDGKAAEPRPDSKENAASRVSTVSNLSGDAAVGSTNPANP